MNSLSTYLNNNLEEVLEKDMLFATLSTKARKLSFENRPPFILIDTVGFIAKLPHELVRSFETTLSDVLTADLLIHVVDGANYDENQLMVTKNVLHSIGADHIERIVVATKSDLAYVRPNIGEDYLLISNKNHDGLNDLVTAIYSHIYLDQKMYLLKIPYEFGGVYNKLLNNSTIIETKYLDDGIYVKSILKDSYFTDYSKYIIE